MGSETLESTSNGTKENEVESSYRIVYFGGAKLPTEYKNLVVAPFLNSLRYGNDLFKLIDKDAYFNNYSRYIETLLNRPMTIIKMAMLKDGTVLGWSMIEYKTIHYLWVKKEVRRQGIARSLLPTEFDTITHITNQGIKMWVTHYPEVRFDPFK